MTTREVTGCSSCPLTDWHEYDGSFWVTCGADESTDGLHLGEHEAPDVAPAECPLRVAPILVTLKVTPSPTVAPGGGILPDKWRAY